jgi:hypothetical protein
MKNSLFLIFFLAVFISCKKDKEDELGIENLGVIISADFRDSIVGNYIGTKNNYSWTMGMPPNQSDTTYAWTFTIVKDTSDSSIIADGYLFKLDSTLTCYEQQLPGPIIRSFIFRNDSAILYFRSGGLGGYSTTTIKGLLQ